MRWDRTLAATPALVARGVVAGAAFVKVGVDTMLLGRAARARSDSLPGT